MDKDIVARSSIPYLGRKYYTEVYFILELTQAEKESNQSKYCIHVNSTTDVQPATKTCMDSWHREHALKEFTPRVKRVGQQTGLACQQLKFQKLEKPWESYTEGFTIKQSLRVYLSLFRTTYMVLNQQSKRISCYAYSDTLFL